MIDLFIKENNVSSKNIIIVRISSFPDENDYLTVLYDFNPAMTVEKNDFDKDFGQFQYTNFKLSFVAEDGINISQILKNKNLKKISNVSFVNVNGHSWNYNPRTMSFYINKNFEYKKTFQNGINEIEFDNKIRRYLNGK